MSGFHTAAPPAAVASETDCQRVPMIEPGATCALQSTIVSVGGGGGGGGGEPEPSSSVRIVVSLSRGPGGVERKSFGLSTISSTIAPSSRCCTCSVCGPSAPK